MNNLSYAQASTLTPGTEWQRLSNAERLVLVEKALTAHASPAHSILSIADAKKDGQVIVCLLEPLPANRRGTVLLDFEATLKDTIDPGLVVWLEPLGDQNSLRNLRGIEVNK